MTGRATSPFRRFAIAVLAQPVLGFGVALQVTTGLGVDPWTLFVQGLGKVLHLSLGQASQLATGGLLVVNYLLGREIPGWGTALSIVLPGLAIDLLLPLLPAPVGWPLRVAVFLIGAVFVALGIAAYVRADLGRGPVEGWVFSIAHRLRLDVGRAKMASDAGFLAVGFLLGGQVGIGTALAALVLGPLLKFFLGHEPSPAAVRDTCHTGQ